MLILLQGCAALAQLKPTSDTVHSSMYTHHSSVEDFYACLQTVVDETFHNDMSKVPFGVYGIEADEATDASNESIIIVFIRYVGDNGVVKSRFIGVRALNQTTADAIFDSIREILVHHSLIEMLLVGLATDGASVMTGVNKGVAARFKRLVPTVVTTHCMAHRLQLLTEKAANRCPAITKYIGVLNTFAKALKFSPKLCRILESSKELYGEDACKVRQVFFTRWLSFVDSVQAIASCLASVISATYAAAAERLADGQAVLLGCARQMATYKFMYLTAFLSDAVGIIAILNKTLQKDALTYAAVKPHIDTTVIALQSL